MKDLNEKIYREKLDATARKNGHATYSRTSFAGTDMQIKVAKEAAIAAMEEVAQFERFKREKKWILDDIVDDRRRYFQMDTDAEAWESELFDQWERERNG